MPLQDFMHFRPSHPHPDNSELRIYVLFKRLKNNIQRQRTQFIAKTQQTLANIDNKCSHFFQRFGNFFAVRANFKAGHQSRYFSVN